MCTSIQICIQIRGHLILAGLDTRQHFPGSGLEEVHIACFLIDLILTMSGKNVCLGQRLAKLELKLISAMFLLGFDYRVIDGTGRVPEPLPRPNWNDLLGCKPPKGTCLLDYRVR